jgi:hemerythrin superfamily protein
MSTDAIVALKDEHQEIRKLFNVFQTAGTSATATKEKLTAKILEKLTVHTFLGNEVMYPEVHTRLPELEGELLESYEKHQVIDVLCMELAEMRPDPERCDAQMRVLIEKVNHHLDEEEKWFPKLRKGVGPAELLEIGARMIEARKAAPRSPAQPSPPGITAGAPAGAPGPTAASRREVESQPATGVGGYPPEVLPEPVPADTAVHSGMTRGAHRRHP